MKMKPVKKTKKIDVFKEKEISNEKSVSIKGGETESGPTRTYDPPSDDEILWVVIR